MCSNDEEKRNKEGKKEKAFIYAIHVLPPDYKSTHLIAKEIGAIKSIA